MEQTTIAVDLAKSVFQVYYHQVFGKYAFQCRGIAADMRCVPLGFKAFKLFLVAAVLRGRPRRALESH